jgi:adhesin transport system outer membrane protein
MKSIVFTVLLSVYMYGQSLTTAVKQGLEIDPRIQMLVHEYAIALRDVELARANYKPTLDVSGFVGRERTQTPANLGKSVTLTAENSSVIGKYNLFSGYKDQYQIKEKETAAKLAENKLKEGIINVSKEITFSYINMIKTYKEYKMYQKNIADYRRTLKKVAQKIKDGGGRDSDLYQTKSRMNYEESNLIAAKQAYQDAKIALAKYIGTIPSIKGMHDPKIHSKKLNLRTLIRKTKKYNASLGNLVLEKEISTFLEEQEKSRYYPSLDVEVSKNWASDQHGILGIDDSDRVGLNLHYNLYNGGSDKIKVEKAKLQTLKAQDSINDATREIIANLKHTYNNYVMSKQRIGVIETHIKNAHKTEVLYIKEEEETGERSIIDILNIRQEYNAAQIAKIETKYTAMQLYFELLANTSEILDYFHISKK